MLEIKWPDILSLIQWKDQNEEGHWDLGSSSVQVWLPMDTASCPSPHLHLDIVMGRQCFIDSLDSVTCLYRSWLLLQCSVPSTQDHVCIVAKPMPHKSLQPRELHS